MPEPTAAALARALAWRVFVNSDDLSLGQFLERLTEYGEACVREAGRDPRVDGRIELS